VQELGDHAGLLAVAGKSLVLLLKILKFDIATG
jgi:hypothetical protein